MGSTLEHEAGVVIAALDEGEFVDAAFERLVRSVQSSIEAVRDAISRDVADPVVKDVFKELCRAIRHAKIDFSRVVRYYGPSYQDCANHFLDFVNQAAELSQNIDYPEVREALQRHADEVTEAHARMKDSE